MKKVLFNKKQSFIFALLTCCVCTSIFSCKFSIESAEKAQAGLRIQVANYDRMFSDSRAVIGSGGNIYIIASSKEAAINDVYGGPIP